MIDFKLHFEEYRAFVNVKVLFLINLITQREHGSSLTNHNESMNNHQKKKKIEFLELKVVGKCAKETLGVQLQNAILKQLD